MYAMNEAAWTPTLEKLFGGIEGQLLMVPGAAGGADEALYGGAVAGDWGAGDGGDADVEVQEAGSEGA